MGIMLNETKIAAVLEDFIVLENIGCRGADGIVFEHYDRLWVPKQFHNLDERGFYEKSVLRVQERGMFIPSIALTFNIMAALYYNRNAPEINKSLKDYIHHYLNDGDGTIQNTLLTKTSIIHYPDKIFWTQVENSDNALLKETHPIDNGRKSICFERKFQDKPSEKSWDDLLNLEWAFIPLELLLKLKSFQHDFRNISGLEDPNILKGIYECAGIDPLVRIKYPFLASNVDSALATLNPRFMFFCAFYDVHDPFDLVPAVSLGPEKLISLEQKRLDDRMGKIREQYGFHKMANIFNSEHYINRD
ncbi:MAG: hypothetical protein V1866_03860 [archaeon]